MNDLIKKYPESNIRKIVNDVFDIVLEKALKDGSCKVTEFGKFESYKTISTKLGSEVIRFKFKISPVLEKKIKFDQYLLNTAPVKAKVSFTDENLQKCNQDTKKANVEASIEAGKLGDLRTKEKEMSQLVMEILNS
jgi:hypothetical protein